MKVLIVKLNPDDERDVTVKISDLELKVFVEHCPYSIEEGESYDADLSLEFFDEDSYLISGNKGYHIEKLPGSYKYKLVGKLNNNRLYIQEDVFIKDDMFTNASSCNNEYLEVIPDRLNISFN